jgi:hypothetical protein
MLLQGADRLAEKYPWQPTIFEQKFVKNAIRMHACQPQLSVIEYIIRIQALYNTMKPIYEFILLGLKMRFSSDMLLLSLSVM